MDIERIDKESLDKIHDFLLKNEKYVKNKKLKRFIKIYPSNEILRVFFFRGFRFYEKIRDLFIMIFGFSLGLLPIYFVIIYATYISGQK